MSLISRENRLALAGYAIAAVGLLVFSLLHTIWRRRVEPDFIVGAELEGLGVTLLGLVLACVGSAMWTRRAQTRAPLKLASLAAVGAIGMTAVIGVNVHEPSAILMLVVLFSVVNVILQLIALGY